MSPTVVLVDDHPVFRRGLASLLAEDGIEVLASVGTLREALDAVAERAPDVVVMDLHLPDGSGVQATRQVVAEHPGVRVLVLSMDSADAAVLAALRAGARGYLLKESAADSIGRTVEAVVRGELVLDGGLAARMPGILAVAASAPPELDGLTPREFEILALVGQGLTNAEIGRRLFLAEKTVRNNVTALLSKTGSVNRPALMAYGREKQG